MRQKWSIILIVSLSLVLILGLSLGVGCSDSEPASNGGGTESSDDAIRVGCLLDLTGSLNIYGLPWMEASRMAIDTINANGGVLGRQVELIEYDTQSDNDLYVKYATDLILEDEVCVIQGAVSSASREAIRPIMDRYETLYFYNVQYEGGVADKLVFCTGTTSDIQVLNMMTYAVENYGPNYYIVAADYNVGWETAAWCRYYGADLGAVAVGEEFVPLEVTEFSTTLAKIQQAKPDFIIAHTVGSNHLAFFREWAAADLKDKYPIVSVNYGLGNEPAILGGEVHEGIAVISAYFEELDNTWNDEFTAKWHELYGDEPINEGCDEAWIGWYLWAMAVEKAGTTETWAVIDALESGLEFNAPEGKVTMDPATHHLERSVHLGIGTITGGYDVIASFDAQVPPWHAATYDLTENPELRTQFTADVLDLEEE